MESAYEFALLKESGKEILLHKTRFKLNCFKGYDTGKYDAVAILVENEIVAGIKCADVLHPVHTAQLISYLKLSQGKPGFLVNFHVPLIKDGIKRFVNNL